MSDDDLEYKRLQLKRLMRLASKVAAPAEKVEQPEKKEPTPLEIVRSRLGERGDYVLQAAMEQFPEETMKIVEQLAELIKSGRVEGMIDGGTLYTLFRRLGLRVRVDTTIKYVKRGEVKDLSELFK
ncbi:MAG: double-stranded DNA-binding protein [Nitrososphaerota archaeon]